MSKLQDTIAQEIWQCYVVEVGRSLPEGMADRMAAAVVAELDLSQFYAPVVVDDDGHTWPRWNEWYDDRVQAQKAVADDPGTVLGSAFVTPWTAENPT